MFAVRTFIPKLLTIIADYYNHIIFIETIRVFLVSIDCICLIIPCFMLPIVVVVVVSLLKMCQTHKHIQSIIKHLNNKRFD